MRRRALMPPLRLDRVESDQVEGDVFEDGEVMGGMAGTGPHLVIGKGDVHAPVQLILHGPMALHGLCQAFCIGRQATDVETLLKGRFSIDTAFRFGSPQRIVAPATAQMGQVIQLVEGETAADFKAPMILLNGFYHRVWRVLVPS